MKCKFCDRNMEPEIVNYLVSDVLIFSEIKCPKCFMILKTKWQNERKIREWQSAGEIIKEKMAVK